MTHATHPSYLPIRNNELDPQTTTITTGQAETVRYTISTSSFELLLANAQPDIEESQVDNESSLLGVVVAGFVVLALVSIILDALNRKFLVEGSMILVLIIAAVGLKATEAVARRDSRSKNY